MGTLIRATRKGGTVAHLMHAETAPSVCGRVMVMIPGGEGMRLCKTCARITGVQLEIDTREFPGLPVVSDWSDTETAFIKGANDSHSLGMCRDVLKQYEERPEEYAHMLRHVAMMYAALRLHTGRDYRDPVDTQAPSMQRRQGDGMVDRNSKSVAKSVLTENQRNAIVKMDNYLMSLTRQVMELQGKDSAAIQPIGEEFFSLLTTRAKINKVFDGYSTQIDKMKVQLAELRKSAPKPAMPSASLTVGLGDICKLDGEYYKVKVSQAGNPYAMRWDGAHWDYDSAKGVIRKLKPEHLATAEDAAQFGHMFHRCVFCSRPLSDERSEAAGYGKDCAETRGLPWGE